MIETARVAPTGVTDPVKRDASATQPALEVTHIDAPQFGNGAQAPKNVQTLATPQRTTASNPSSAAAPVAPTVQAQRQNPSRTVQLIDDTAVAQLWQKPEFAAKITALYLQDTESYLRQIADGIIGADPEAVVLAAHTIKSSSKIVGATGMSALAEVLESGLRNKQLSEAQMRQLSDRMRKAFAQTRQNLGLRAA